MRKLNVWKRLGIVLSVLWAVSGFGYTYNSAAQQAVQTGKYWANTCVEIHKTETNGADVDDPSCWSGPNSSYQYGYDLGFKGAFISALFVALVPLPFLWLIGWGALATVRWVLRGREVTA